MSDGSQDAAARVEAAAGPRFRLPIYEGPLDLLLHLIKRAELDARDVTASVITEQYLAYLELLDSLNLDVAGEYLVMAATLLLIKSFSMLPHAGTEELEEAEELKRDLVARLLEYQRYREAAEKLGARALLGRDVFAAPGEKLPEQPPEEDGHGAAAQRVAVRPGRGDGGGAEAADRHRAAPDRAARHPGRRMHPADHGGARAGRRRGGIRGAVRGFSRSERSAGADRDLHGVAGADPAGPGAVHARSGASVRSCSSGASRRLPAKRRRRPQASSSERASSAIDVVF